MTKQWGCIFLVLLVSLIIGCSSPAKTNNTVNDPVTQPEVQIVYNTSGFSKVSASELEQKMGAPDSIENWTFNDKYEATTYTYDSGNTEFMVIDDTVVRFTYYPDDLVIKDNSELFPMFGIEPGENMKKVSDTGVALEYHTVSDAIGEFYILKNGDNITDIKVTYDLRYFE